MVRKIKTATVRDIETFFECPVHWYIKNKQRTLENPDDAKLKEVWTLLLCKLMANNKITKNMLFSKIESKSFESYNTDDIKEAMPGLITKFTKDKLNIRCINLPFSLKLGDITIIDTIDMIRKNPYGIDIILFTYSETINIEKLESNPSFLIYILAVNEIFKEEIYSINVYNIRTEKLIDISRRTDIMCDQMDKLKNILTDISTMDIVPKLSLECKTCSTQEHCFRSYYQIESEIND